VTLLGELEPGEHARVAGYRNEDPAYRAQLLALGLTPGALAEVVRRAPLGDPIQIRVRGAALFLRKSDANVIVVEKC